MVDRWNGILASIRSPHAERDERGNLQMLANVACHIVTTLRLLLSQNKPSEISTLTMSLAPQTGYLRLTAPRARSLPFGQFNRRGFKPQCQRFLGISNGFLFRVPRSGAARQFGAYCRPAFGFWIKFYQQPEFHCWNDNRLAASNQADRHETIVRRSEGRTMDTSETVGATRP